MLESVRDSQVPIWDLLGRDDPKAPSLVEALDLNCMLVRERRALGDMAEELGETESAVRWRRRADELSARINAAMWDPQTRFYYNVDRATNGFTVTTPAGATLDLGDIRCGELSLLLSISADPGVPLPDIGGVDTPQESNGLVIELAHVRHRLVRAEALADVVGPLGQRFVGRDFLQRAQRLEMPYLLETVGGGRAHPLEGGWESYSPDDEKLGSPMNYIWGSILARVILDLQEEGR